MSDLQCPATLLIALPGEATSVRHLVDLLRRRRIAAVYSGRMGHAVESAALAASALGLKPVVVDEIAVDEIAVSAPDLAKERFRGALDAVADVHRGETVLVFVHRDLLAWVPGISVNTRGTVATQDVLPSCVPAEVEVDADGWRLVSWPGVWSG